MCFYINTLKSQCFGYKFVKTYFTCSKLQLNIFKYSGEQFKNAKRCIYTKVQLKRLLVHFAPLVHFTPASPTPLTQTLLLYSLFHPTTIHCQSLMDLEECLLFQIYSLICHRIVSDVYFRIFRSRYR